MERAGRLLRASKAITACVTPEDIARAAWPAAAGKKVAAHTRAAALVRGRLVVEVEDMIWQQQLFTLRRQFLKNLEAVAGPGIVSEVEFRVTPRRKLPVREERPVRDESDGIADPFLSRLYRASRRRAQA